MWKASGVCMPQHCVCLCLQLCEPPFLGSQWDTFQESCTRMYTKVFVSTLEDDWNPLEHMWMVSLTKQESAQRALEQEFNLTWCRIHDTRQECYIHLHRDIVSNVILFSVCDEKTQREICYRLHSCYRAAGSQVLTAGSIDLRDSLHLYVQMHHVMYLECLHACMYY